MPGRSTRYDVGERRPAIPRRTLVTVGLVVLLGLLGAAAGIAWHRSSSDTVQARAVVLVTPLYGNPYAATGTSDDLVDLQTEAQLVVSEDVGEEVGRLLGTGVPVSQTLSGVSVEVPANTQLLEITAPGDDGDAARGAAEAFAATYLDYRRTVAESALFERAATLTEEVDALERERVLIADELAGPAVAGPRAAQLTEQSTAAVARIDELRAELGELRATPLDPGRIVTPAAVEGGFPGGALALAALGFLVGALLGAGVVAVVRRLGDVVHSADDLGRAETPVLGVLPALPAGHPSTSWLRASVLSLHRELPTAVLVVEAAPQVPVPHDVPRTREEIGGGLTGTFAVQCAASRLRTMVVDVTGAGGPRPGLTQVLTDPDVLDDVVLRVGPYLQFLGAGDDPAALDDLAASPEMTALMEQLREEHDVVVLTSGEPGSARTQALAAAADVVLMAVPPGEVRLDDLDGAAAMLGQLGAGVVRTVLVLPGDRGPVMELPPVVSV